MQQQIPEKWSAERGLRFSRGWNAAAVCPPTEEPPCSRWGSPRGQRTTRDANWGHVVGTRGSPGTRRDDIAGHERVGHSYPGFSRDGQGYAAWLARSRSPREAYSGGLWSESLVAVGTGFRRGACVSGGDVGRSRRRPITFSPDGCRDRSAKRTRPGRSPTARSISRNRQLADAHLAVGQPDSAAHEYAPAILYLRAGGATAAVKRAERALADLAPRPGLSEGRAGPRPMCEATLTG